MGAPESVAPKPSDTCPACGGSLGEPTSGSVHCYRKCSNCGEEFQLDDPRLA